MAHLAQFVIRADWRICRKLLARVDLPRENVDLEQIVPFVPLCIPVPVAMGLRAKSPAMRLQRLARASRRKALWLENDWIMMRGSRKTRGKWDAVAEMLSGNQRASVYHLPGCGCKVRCGSGEAGAVSRGVQ